MQLTTKSTLAAVMILFVLNCASVHSRTLVRLADREQDRVTNAWVDSNYATVLNALLPSGEVAPEKFPKHIKWLVTVRISPPFEEPESRFSLHKTYDDKVEAHVITAKGASIVSQLRALKNKYPDATVEKISSLVSVDQRTISQIGCSQLSHLADQFEAISMSPVLPDELGVDETGYEFWSQSLWGNRMNVLLSGPGSVAKKQPHPLLQWAENVRSVIETCTKK